MKDFIKSLLSIYMVISVFAFAMGMVFGVEGKGPRALTRRIHYVLPAYAVGYWLTEPWKGEEK
jgi:hypothetical protein